MITYTHNTYRSSKLLSGIRMRRDSSVKRRDAVLKRVIAEMRKRDMSDVPNPNTVLEAMELWEEMMIADMMRNTKQTEASRTEVMSALSA